MYKFRKSKKILSTINLSAIKISIRVTTLPFYLWQYRIKTAVSDITYMIYIYAFYGHVKFVMWFYILI